MAEWGLPVTLREIIEKRIKHLRAKRKGVMWTEKMDAQIGVLESVLDEFVVAFGANVPRETSAIVRHGPSAKPHEEWVKEQIDSTPPGGRTVIGGMSVSLPPLEDNARKEE